MNEQPNVAQIKANLAAAIVGLIDARKLNDIDASDWLRLPPSAIPCLRVGDVADFSIDRLILVLNDADQRVDAQVVPDSTIRQRSTVEAEPTSSNEAVLAIIKFMEERHANAPPGTYDSLPTDLAANHDHYL